MGAAIKGGTTNVSTVIRIVDSTTGLPETAVEHNTAGIDLWYRRDVDPGGTPLAKVSLTEAALAALTTAHADGGIEHIGDGYYRLDLPDAAVAGGAIGVLVGGTVTGMMVIGNYHQLVDYDPNDAVRLGLTALPNAAADAAGGLPISDAGGLDMDAILADTNELQADWVNGGRLDLIVDELTTNIDAIEADTQDLQTQVGTAGAGLTAITGVQLAADQAVNATKFGGAAVTATTSVTFPASSTVATTAGAVGSVTGAVGSVTGHTPQTGDTYALANGAQGFAAIDTVVDGIQTDLSNGTDGLGALKTLIDAIQTEVNKVTQTAHAEPTGVPAANEAPIDKLGYLFMALRNQVDVTATKKTFYDDGGTAEWEKDLSDNGTTYSESEGNAI